MIRYFLACCGLILNIALQAQDFYGYRHLQMFFRGDTVDMLIKSKKGEEQVKKPLFLFCQGSLPQPLLIRYEHNGQTAVTNAFVFNPDSLARNYHVAVISKAYVPLVADQRKLNPDFTYSDSSGQFPRKYLERYYLDYYVERNLAVIAFLQRQSWIARSPLVVAGHSEGSTIAAKMAASSPLITHLIYSGGNPQGRMLTLIERERAHETDSTGGTGALFNRWEKIIAAPQNMDFSQGDTYKVTNDFSYPPVHYLSKLKIPVLITFGTRDAGVPYLDMFRLEMIRQHKRNFFFREYIGTEHNYFPLKPDGEPDYNVFNWDKVAEDWRQWLSTH
ncbi:alpha/beta hydrolase [Chitinophaga qingshengii]|uniref:Alpha/beta hydrolase n=1 Tax=Chitinophaga qingshengii TaxID=1569794 RepID=A0ABR7TK99_9BACT|nr:alpha/beta hydrolase [Chitinophaga qingshengii]MBC9930917.1 alpha/beta hydrolase [Chitinophaga qingshengii]